MFLYQNFLQLISRPSCVYFYKIILYFNTLLYSTLVLFLCITHFCVQTQVRIQHSALPFGHFPFHIKPNFIWIPTTIDFCITTSNWHTVIVQVQCDSVSKSRRMDDGRSWVMGIAITSDVTRISKCCLLVSLSAIEACCISENSYFWGYFKMTQ